MRTRTLAGTALTLLALVGSTAHGQNNNQNQNQNTSNANSNRSGSDQNAGKEVTVRGVIAGVTVEGETAINFASHRAETVEATYLTIVGEEKGDSADRNRDGKNANDDKRADKQDSNRTRMRRRHNVYIVWMTPKTELKDGTSGGQGSGDRASSSAAKTTLDKIEVGDRVEVTMHRREFSRSGGNDAENQRWMRHGRHRTYFGDAVSLTVLSQPSHEATPRSDQDRNRDDDKDKTKNSGGNNSDKSNGDEDRSSGDKGR